MFIMPNYGPTNKFQSKEQEELFNLLARQKTLDIALLLDVPGVSKMLSRSKKTPRKLLYMRLRGRVQALYNRLSQRSQPLPF
jgi:hypothetical protein